MDPQGCGRRGDARRGRPTGRLQGRLARLWVSATIVGTILFLVHGAATAKSLSGHVYVRTPVGEAKRIADLEVVLIRATPEFEAEWHALVEVFKRERSAALEALRRAKEDKDAAQAEYLRLAPAGGPAFQGAVGREKAAFEALAQAEKTAGALPGQYPGMAREVITRHRMRTVRTGADSLYDFEDVRPGRYYVFAEHHVVELRHVPRLGTLPVVLARFVWLVPVTVADRPARLDLAGSNAGWPFEMPELRPR